MYIFILPLLMNFPLFLRPHNLLEVDNIYEADAREKGQPVQAEKVY